MRNGDWMQTYTGKKFWPIDPRPEDIDIEDIAHALSMMCRYNGHCHRFYSVAEHSVYVSLHVPQEYALWGLLHDASEAYIADIVKPAKRFINGYKDVENRIMQCVIEKFKLAPIEPPEVKQIDTALLSDEIDQIMRKGNNVWDLPYPPLGRQIVGFDPYTARKFFINRYNELI